LYTPANTSGGAYGLVLAGKYQIWMTLTQQNKLARFDTNTNRFTYYQVPTEGSSPFGVVMDTRGTLWFTETVGNKLGAFKP
jgi:virginiamycin B lyase